MAVSIVFLHGLNGHPENTWTYKEGEESFYWPWELRKYFENLRVIVYGYNADLETGFERNLVRIRNLASSLVTDLTNIRDEPEVNQNSLQSVKCSPFDKRIIYRLKTGQLFLWHTVLADWS